MAAVGDNCIAGSKVKGRRTSINPFSTDITETSGVNMDAAHADFGYISNPFVASMELSLAERETDAHTSPPWRNVEWPPTPPPTLPTNPFTTPTAQLTAAYSGSAASPQLSNPFTSMDYNCCLISTPVAPVQSPFTLQTVSPFSHGAPPMGQYKHSTQ